MKLFRHYKGKPYKYVGQAKHSETLEDMVIYETRYENELGTTWVRPKNMFFETLDINGSSTSRFEKISLDLKSVDQITDAEIQTIAPIVAQVFGEWDEEWFYSKFQHHKKFHLILAYVEQQAVGFKLGYGLSQEEFYSWLGAVLPDFRGLGIAADLMRAQHEWCRTNGYRKIQTKTQNRFRDMLLLNIQFGFDIIGFHQSDKGPKIILEKMLE